MIEGSFKSTHNYNQRLEEANRIMEKYEYRYPIIVETQKKHELTLDKCKFLVPNTLTVGQFIYTLRKRMKVKPEQAVFMFLNNMIVPTGGEIGNIYREFKDDDGFLYMVISTENTFGF